MEQDKKEDMMIAIVEKEVKEVHLGGKDGKRNR